MAENAFTRFGNRLFDPGTLSDKNVQQNRQMADLLLNQVSRPQNIQSPTQGLAVLAQALNAQAFRQRAERGDSALQEQKAQQMGALLNSLNLDPSQQGILENLPENIQPQALGAVASNKLLPQAPKDQRTATQKDFAFARENGFEGSFEDFMKIRSSSTTVNVGGESKFKIPPGFMMNETNDGVVPIPGGPQDSLSVEASSKAQLIETALSSSKSFREIIFNEDGTVNRKNVLNVVFSTPFTEGRQGKVFLLDAVEAKLRAESGAAVPETEVVRAFKRFQPSPFDDDATITTKTELLSGFLEGTFDKFQRDGRFDLDATLDSFEKMAEKSLGSSSAADFVYDPATGKLVKQ